MKQDLVFKYPFLPPIFPTYFWLLLTSSFPGFLSWSSPLSLRSLQLQAKLLEAERQLGEVQGRLKEQRQLSGEKLKDREQQAADLQLKLSRAEEQVKDETLLITIGKLNGICS